MIAPNILLQAAGSALLLASSTSAFVITPKYHDKIPAGGLQTKPILPRQAADPTSQLLSIVPSASSCDGAPFPSECATAAQAVQPIIASFATYKITTAPEQAALLSWMAYESGEFKYDMNHYPGRPGQGTRNMMMPNFVSQYASSVGVDSQGAPADVLNAVIAKGDDWGSAAWFYSTQCSDDIKNGLQTGGRSGWQNFITNCVQTDVNEGSGSTSRVAYWERAAQALGMSTN